MPRSLSSALVIAMVLSLGGGADAQPLDHQVARALDDFTALHRVSLAIPASNGQSLRLVRGSLTEPSARGEARIVRDLVARQGVLFGVQDEAGLVERRLNRVGESRVVRFRQTVDGVPVVGAHLTALLDRSGRVRQVMQSLADTTHRGEFLLRPVEAAEIAGAEIIRPAHRPRADHAAAVYVPTAEGLVSAFAVHFGAAPVLLSNWYVIVDATTGEVMARMNGIQFDRIGLAFADNPTLSELEPVVLHSLDLDNQDCIAEDALPPAGPDGEETPGASVPRLCTARISARNCWDFNETIPLNVPGLGTVAAHSCTDYHMAVPNDAPSDVEDPDDEIANDFYYEDHQASERYDYFNDDAAGEDLFAEQHALYHMERVYDYYESLAPELFDTLQEGRLRVSVNWRLPINYAELVNSDIDDVMTAVLGGLDRNGPLYPFDNAMYVPGGNLFGILERPESSIMLFQGRRRDFAYDADVIYHEFGHAVVGTVVDGIGLSSVRRDDQGIHQFSYAMNEAYADFFSGALTRDSVMSDYALASYARDLSARPRHTCPERLSNEEHYDSAPYSEALWEIRETLEAAAVERAVFAALCTLTPEASFQDGAAATVTALETELGSAAAATAGDIFAQYGYDDENRCERVLDVESGGGLDDFLLFGTVQGARTMAPYAPSLLQFRIDVPAGTRQIIVRYRKGWGLDDMMAMIFGTEMLPGLLVRLGDEAITFSESGEVTSDADDFVATAEADPAVPDGFRLVYHLDGDPLPAGNAHLMIVNSGEADGTIVGVEVEASPVLPGVSPDGGPTMDGGGDEPSGQIDAGTEAGLGQYSAGGGCSCSPAGASGPSRGARWLRLLAL